MLFRLFIDLLWWLLLYVWFEGAIELSILADYYGREIAAYDIQTTRCDLYGQVSSFLASFVHEILASSALLNIPFFLLFPVFSLTGKEVFWKSYAHLRRASLWCFSCMMFYDQFPIIIFFLFVLLVVRSENFKNPITQSCTCKKVSELAFN